MKDPITEEERIKAIPGKEMLGAITSMNTYLEGKGQPLIVFEKQAKNVALENLLVPILAAIEAGEAETLPDDVITFFNTHLVTEEEPEKEDIKKAGKAGKAGKAKKAPKEKKVPKEKAPKKPSNEQTTYDMVKVGKTDAEILEHFKTVYGSEKDDKFIAKRACIYANIAKRKFASEDVAFAARWDAEKEAAKPKAAPPAPKVTKKAVTKAVKTVKAAKEPVAKAPAPKRDTK